MFKVFCDKYGWVRGVGRPLTVYHVQMNKKGYPHFLIYHDGQWLYVSAKHCTPAP